MWTKHKKVISAYLIVALVAGSFIYFGLHPQIAEAACTPGSGWSYCNTLTIDHTKVSTVNQTALTGGFVVEASSTDAQLETVANGGHVQNLTTESGSSFTGQVPADLQFSTSSSFSTLLPGWEFESYSSTTGTFIAWLNAGSSISTSSDTTIYFQYGDASVSTWQGNVNGTWNSNYKGVYHLPNGSSLNINDSTSNAKNGTNHSATATSGIIDGAASFSGSPYISLPGNIVSSNVVTTSIWAKITTLNNYQALLDIYTGNSDSMEIYVNAGNNQVCGGNFSNPACSATNSLTAGTWAYITLTSTGSVTQFYINGVASGTTGITNFTTFSTNFAIGARPDASIPVTGIIDEARISNIALSADWISTEYNNQSAPDKANYGSSGFYTIGTEQSGPTGPIAAHSTTYIPGTKNVSVIVGLPSTSNPAISYDTSANSGVLTSTSSPNMAYTVSGSNTALLVAFTNDSNSTSTGATYNGVSMTRVQPDQPGAIMGGTGNMGMYYLLGAPTGTHSLVVTFSGSQSHVLMVASSYDNVKQSGLDNSNVNGVSITTSGVNESLTVNTANSWVITAVGAAGARGIGQDSDNVIQNLDSGSFAQGNVAMGNSNGPKGTGSDTVNFVANNTVAGIIYMVSLAPVAPTVTQSNSTLYIPGN